MRKTMAPSRSVHFIDSETISKQIFAPARYNLPLFLCKKLNVHSTPVENSTKQQWTGDHGRTALLQRMAKYHINELTKDPSYRKEKSFKISQPQSGALGVRPSRRCNAHRAGWPHCPRPLRDGRKEWSLPPGRYRLGGSIADLANRSTGTKGRAGHPTKGRYAANQGRMRLSLHEKYTATGNDSSDHLDTINAINLPAEMNKLLLPCKYFVGKIRPGDRMNERPTTRLTLSNLTACRRDPNDPGPGQYDPEPQSRSQEPAAPKKMSHSTSPCCYTYDQYCCEPFFRPPPGRYDIRAAQPPIATGTVRYRSEQIHIPIQSTTSKPPHPDGDARRRPLSKGRKVTLRLNSINIPVRPRKGRRNMKVAFMSGSARFRDRDFFPIGGLGKATASSSSKRHRQPQPATSKKLHDTEGWSQHDAPSGSATRTSLSVERTDWDGHEAQRPEKEGEDCVQFLAAHGICSQGTLPLSRPGNKMSTRFFTVPKLTRHRQ